MMAKTRRYRIEGNVVYSGIVGYNDVAIETPLGRFATRVERVPGSPAWPMTREDRIEKFIDCAGRVLGRPGAERLLALLERCRDVGDVREIMRASVPATPRETRATTTT